MGLDSFMYVHVVHCSMLLLTLYLNVQNTCTNVNHPIVPPEAHKRHEVAPRSVQLCMIAWNSDVLTKAARSLFGLQLRNTYYRSYTSVQLLL